MRRITLVAAGCAGLVVAACETNASPPPARPGSVATAAAEATPPAALRLVPPNQVCMMNDRFMGIEQIPVAIEGRTYFGCCAMCKERLDRDPAARRAKDPVSGNVVDKATALIGARPDGSVLYFETTHSFEAFARTATGAALRSAVLSMPAGAEPSSASATAAAPLASAASPPVVPPPRGNDAPGAAKPVPAKGKEPPASAAAQAPAGSAEGAPRAGVAAVEVPAALPAAGTASPNPPSSASAPPGRKHAGHASCGQGTCG